MPPGLTAMLVLLLGLWACANQLDLAQRELRRRGVGLDNESFLAAVRADDKEVSRQCCLAADLPDLGVVRAGEQRVDLLEHPCDRRRVANC